MTTYEKCGDPGCWCWSQPMVVAGSPDYGLAPAVPVRPKPQKRSRTEELEDEVARLKAKAKKDQESIWECEAYIKDLERERASLTKSLAEVVECRHKEYQQGELVKAAITERAARAEADLVRVRREKDTAWKRAEAFAGKLAILQQFVRDNT